MEAGRRRGCGKKRKDLFFKHLDGDGWLAAAVVRPAPGAVVVHVLAAEAVALVLGGDGEAALATTDEARVGERVPLGARPTGAPEEHLDFVVFVEGHHGRMFSGIDLVLPFEDTRVCKFYTKKEMICKRLKALL